MDYVTNGTKLVALNQPKKSVEVHDNLDLKCNRKINFFYLSNLLYFRPVVLVNFRLDVTN